MPDVRFLIQICLIFLILRNILTCFIPFQQLAILERVNTPTCQLDKARALGSLGDCYDALGDPDEAAKYHEQHLAAALKLDNKREQERAYRGLGLSHK